MIYSTIIRELAGLYVRKKKHLKPKRELTALFLRVYIAYSTTLFGEELFMLIS
jgi:hypothetical protein